MEVTTQVPGSKAREPIQKHFFSDMSVMLGRSMRHIFRSVDTIFTVTIMPIGIMLLFVYVFGGAIQTGTANYVNYLLPGISIFALFG
jgi:ABC-2 type transport system permease protein